MRSPKSLLYFFYLAKKGLPPHFPARLFNALQNQCLLDGVKANGSAEERRVAAASSAELGEQEVLAKLSEDVLDMCERSFTLRRVKSKGLLLVSREKARLALVFVCMCMCKKTVMCNALETPQ